MTMAAGVMIVRIRRPGVGDVRIEVPYTDDKLQQLMDRANAEFGDPTKQLGGPEPVQAKPVPPPGGRRRR